MIKYQIIAQEGDRQARAYIDSLRPLTGDEPVLKQRLEALNELLTPDDEFTKAFKKIITESIEA